MPVWDAVGSIGTAGGGGTGEQLAGHGLARMVVVVDHHRMAAHMGSAERHAVTADCMPWRVCLLFSHEVPNNSKFTTLKSTP